MELNKSIKSLLNSDFLPVPPPVPPRKEPLKWRLNQEKNWELYLTNSSFYNNINSLVYGVVGEGFNIKSLDPKLNNFLYELINAPKNKLYSNIYEWLVRILVQNELFLLVEANELGEIELKVLPPERIGTLGEDGIISTPEGRVVYYRLNTGEIIPDICISSEPELKNKINIKVSETPGFYSRIGGFCKFIVCWKNLEGVSISSRGLVFPYTESTELCISKERIREVQFKFDNFLKYHFLNYIINLRDLLSNIPNTGESVVSIHFPPTMSLDKIKLMIDLGISEEKIAKELGLDYAEEIKIKIEERAKQEQLITDKLLKEDIARNETITLFRESLNTLTSKFDNQTETLRSILLKEQAPMNVSVDPQSIDIGIKMDGPKSKPKRKKGTILRDETGKYTGFETVEFDVTEEGN